MNGLQETKLYYYFTSLINDCCFDYFLVYSCQTYEGGFAGQPAMEAHGGYAFCSVAALVILGHERLCDTEALLVSIMLKLHPIFSVLLWRIQACQ